MYEISREDEVFATAETPSEAFDVFERHFNKYNWTYSEDAIEVLEENGSVTFENKETYVFVRIEKTE